jgi:hypothetical protein
MIPLALRKQIKAKCTNLGEWRLAAREQSIRTEKGFSWQGNSGTYFPINTKRIEGNFQWYETALIFNQKPILTTTKSSNFTVIRDLNENNPLLYLKNYAATKATTSNFFLDGIRVGGVINASDEVRDIRKSRSFITQQFGLITDNKSDVRILRRLEYYLVSCRCPNGQDIDCPRLPSGYCCISYRVIEGACLTLNN